MKSFPTTIATILLALSLQVSAADRNAITEAVRLLDGQEATFVQRFLPRGYKKEQVETGKVVFGRTPASRWSYETPEEKAFVFDGDTSWMYVPADETVMVHRVSAAEKNRLPFFVLSDPARMDEWYAIRESGGRTTLTAKHDDALLRSIELELDSTGRIETLTYFDAQGNRTAFELSGWTKAATTEETFTFTPPPGVDVIEN